MFASLVVILLLTLINVAKSDVVVFVHGLGGYGPTEKGGVGYWGNPGIYPEQNYFNILRAKGFTVYEASVGPVSSNHDRACELYAQIKGTKVDYGEVHSARHKHARYGRDYTGKGFYPTWSGTKKIHLIGHSMGGTTIRQLEHYLQVGIPEEVTKSGTGVSPLFQRGSVKPGGGNWIQSITTLATPFNGSPMIAKVPSSLLSTVVKYLVKGFIGDNTDFDFDLQHYGITRLAGETNDKYVERLLSSGMLKPDNLDNAVNDLGLPASAKFNEISALAYSGTYYFSVATDKTYRCYNPFSGMFSRDSCPELSMTGTYALTALYMGSLDEFKDPYGKALGNDWEPNDGIVPVISSKSPRLGIRNFVAPREWTAQTRWTKGVWYTITVRKDHGSIIGARKDANVVEMADGTYQLIADTLNLLKIGSAAELESTSEGTSDVVEGELDEGAIAGIVIGSLAAVALVAFAVVRRRRSSAEKSNPHMMSGSWASPMAPSEANKKMPRSSNLALDAGEKSPEAVNPVYASENLKI